MWTSLMPGIAKWIRMVLRHDCEMGSQTKQIFGSCREMTEWCSDAF